MVAVKFKSWGHFVFLNVQLWGEFNGLRFGFLSKRTCVKHCWATRSNIPLLSAMRRTGFNNSSYPNKPCFRLQRLLPGHSSLLSIQVKLYFTHEKYKVVQEAQNSLIPFFACATKYHTNIGKSAKGLLRVPRQPCFGLSLWQPNYKMETTKWHALIIHTMLARCGNNITTPRPHL